MIVINCSNLISTTNFNYRIILQWSLRQVKLLQLSSLDIKIFAINWQLCIWSACFKPIVTWSKCVLCIGHLAEVFGYRPKARSTKSPPLQNENLYFLASTGFLWLLLPSNSEKIPAEARPIPAQPCCDIAWPFKKIESKTENTLRVVVTVVHTSGSKLAIV